MSKILYSAPKIFAGSATPAGNISEFGTFKGGSVIYSSDLDIIQGYTGATGITGLSNQSAWQTGWRGAVDANLNPTFQDMNAFLYAETYQLGYLYQHGVPEWLSTMTYYKNAIVSSSTGEIYISLTDDNLNNALSVTLNWMLIFSNNVYNIGTSEVLQYNHFVVNWKTPAPTGGDHTIFLPSPATRFKNRIFYIVISASTATSTVLIYSNTTIHPGMAQGDAIKFICTGSSWFYLPHR